MSLCSFIDEIPLQPTPYIGQNGVEGFSNTVVPFMASLLFMIAIAIHTKYTK